MSETSVERVWFPTTCAHSQTGSPQGQQVVLPASHTTTYYNDLFTP